MPPTTRLLATGPLNSRLAAFAQRRLAGDFAASADVDTGLPQAFRDGMRIRDEVFVREQGVPLENELDEDDARSFHWTLYVGSEEQPWTPVGVVRLVPPTHGHGSGAPYVKLGRLAVLKAFREKGYAGELVKAILGFVEAHAGLFDGVGGRFEGRVCVHAQVGTEKFYERAGFVRDEGMGTWVEEGILHVGMWRG